MNGHFWTIAGHLGKGLSPAGLPPSRLWTTHVPDARIGPVKLTGRLSHCAGSSTLVIIVHGLGGSSQSPYTFEAAAAASELGFASLRLNLRGADLRGEDLFHAGLGSDLQGVLASSELSRFARVLLLGYSLGGHVCLNYVASGADPRVRAVAALCSPLDLAASARAFDAPHLFTYRRHVLSGLVGMYRQVHERRGGLPISVSAAQKIQSIQEWDDRVVAPRHGFASKEHYYSVASVAPHLSKIQLPALLLSSPRDPMVPRAAVSPYWQDLPPHVRILEKSPGGHIAFPKSFSIGEDAPLGVEAQVIRWLEREAA